MSVLIKKRQREGVPSDGGTGLCPDCGGWWSYPRAKTHRTGYRSFSFTDKIILKIV